MPPGTSANPNPGSYAAFTAGCLCPRIDNSYGRGWRWATNLSPAQYVIVEGCPLHASKGQTNVEADPLPVRKHMGPARRSD